MLPGLKRHKRSPGTLIVIEHAPKIVKDNPLGDPQMRKLPVWLPCLAAISRLRFWTS